MAEAGRIEPGVGEPEVVLGFDTATASVTAAATRGAALISEATVPPSPGGRPRHIAELLVAVGAVVRAAGGWSSIEAIAVGVGPGTFTGLRIGIATARALAQARAVPLAPVSSLAALARGIEAPASRPRLALIDARRGEAFAALHDAAGAVLCEPFVAPPEEIADQALRGGEPPLAAGDGSLRFREQLEAAGVEVLPDASPAHRMAARNVCALAPGSLRVGPEELKPIYLRRPDAEVWREQQAGHRD